ncbi:MAG TPA: aminotransferase class IV [Thermoanaerobaculia bacterium]|nr:aminotransferase class IV [Thermoanaerobaculia bacterium]
MSLSFWNGRFLPEAEVRIPPDDAGFLFGDGLFETLRVDAGQAGDVEAHLDRLLAGLARIGIEIPEDRDALEAAIAEVAEAAPWPTARLRVTVTRSPTRLVTAAPYQPPGDRVSVLLLSDLRIDSQGPLAGLKSLCYQMNRLALRRAEAAGAWEALLLNERGRLVEGARSNLALALPDGVFTPPLEDGCLPGTVRRRLLEQGTIAERSLSLEDLERAGGIYLLNSLVGILKVGEVNGRPVPVGRPLDRFTGPEPRRAPRRPPPA